MKRYLLYLGRWQLSSPILAACLIFLPFNPFINTIVANFIGGATFYWVDRIIFKNTDRTCFKKGG